MTGAATRVGAWLLVLGVLGLGGPALAESSQIDSDAARAAQVARDLQYKNITVNQIAALSATDDGAVWAITSGGTLLHCLFDRPQQRVRCYDRDGPAKPVY